MSTGACWRCVLADEPGKNMLACIAWMLRETILCFPGVLSGRTSWHGKPPRVRARMAARLVRSSSGARQDGLSKRVGEVMIDQMGRGRLPAQLPRQFPNKVYPWDEWGDGRALRLRRGRDFTVLATSMKSAASQEARRRGMRCRVLIENPDTVIIQFVAR